MKSFDLLPNQRWYLVNTQTGREVLAEANLARQGYRPFVPTTWKSVRHARKITNVKAAYFPGYLFVPLDLERDRWRPIDGTLGVLRLVKANERPLAAPIGLVETLIEQVSGDGALDRAGPSLTSGQSVKLIRGPFAEQLASVERMSGPDRVRVLLAMMGQVVPIEVQRQDLAIA